MRLAIIGGGWAGLSAAVTAVGLGHRVRLHESAATLGGRARSIDAPGLGARIDNGQHILLGAYTATLALMCDLGLDPERLFLRLPLNVRSADGTIRLQAPPGLPAPLHVAAALLTARGLSWREKQAALRAMRALRRRHWETPPGFTVQQWLEATGQSARAQQLLWIPLCIATLNTPAGRACAQLFAHVLRDSLGTRERGASDMLIPRTGLTELWPARVEELARSGGLSACAGGENATSTGHPAGTALHAEMPAGSTIGPPGRLEMRCSHTVRQLRYAGGGLALDDLPDTYDAVLVCGNTPSTARLLETLPPRPGGAGFVAGLHAFAHAPIATLTVELQRPWRLPAAMLLLHEDRQRGHFGQWLFQGQDAEGRLLHVVVSDAGALLQRPRSEAVAGMLDQLKAQLRGQDMPPAVNHALIVEKRATFLAVPGLKRPGNRTPWPGVWVAGDWTDTGYPAVLEGAVRSGRDAVLAFHESTCLGS